MATLSNRTFFQDGVTPAESSVVGFEREMNRVVRYNLDLSRGESARNIKIVFVGNPGEVCISFGGGGPGASEINKSMSFYFAISTDPDAFANAGYADIASATGKAIFTQVGGYEAGESAKYEVSCDADVMLYPETQYYLWVFPGFSSKIPGGNYTWGFVYWNTTPIEITLTGEVGLVYVGELSGIPYIWHNGAWCQGLPKTIEQTTFLTTTDDAEGNVILYGRVSATGDGVENVILAGAVVTEDEDGNVTIEGGTE